MVTRVTAMMIQGNVKDLKIDTDKQNGKWAGHINLYKLGQFHTELASTTYIHRSDKEASDAAQIIIDEVCKLDLSKSI